MSEPATVKKVSIGSEHNVTADDIIAEANGIYKVVLAEYEKIKSKSNGRGGQVPKRNSDEKIIDELYTQLRDKHKDFSSSYPTVMRHMVQDCWYDSAAFTKYMREVAKKPWTNDTERMDSYTRYAELLLRETNSAKHMNTTTINAFKRDYRGRLQNEHDTFMKNIERMQAKVAEEEEATDKMKRGELLLAFRRLAISAGVNEQRRLDIEALVTGNLMKTSMLESIVYDIRKVIAGESAESIRKEREEHEDKVIEARTHTTAVMPEGIDAATESSLTSLITKAATEKLN